MRPPCRDLFSASADRRVPTASATEDRAQHGGVLESSPGFISTAGWPPTRKARKFLAEKYGQAVALFGTAPCPCLYSAGLRQSRRVLRRRTALATQEILMRAHQIELRLFTPRSLVPFPF